MHSLYRIIGDIFTQHENIIRIKCFIKSLTGKAPDCIKTDGHLCHISHILLVTCFFTAWHVAQLKMLLIPTYRITNLHFFNISLLLLDEVLLKNFYIYASNF